MFDRVLSALSIFCGDFLTDCALGIPDLFMPFWLPITLVFLMFFSGTIAQVAQSGFNNPTGFYVFMGIIVGYVYVITAILFAISYCLDMPISFSVCVQISAYSLIILLPTCALIPLIAWMPTFVLPIIFSLSAGWSTLFVVRNVWKYSMQYATTGARRVGFAISFIAIHCCVMVALGCALFVV